MSQASHSRVSEVASRFGYVIPSLKRLLQIMIVGIHVKKMPKKGIKHRPTKLARRILYLEKGRRTGSVVALAGVLAQPSPRRDVDRGIRDTSV